MPVAGIALDDLFVLLRLARAGRVDQPAAGCEHRRPRARASPAAPCASAGRSVFAAPPLDVGIAPERAEAGAGRVEQDAIERPAERQRHGRRPPGRSRTLVAPERRTVSREQVDPAPADVGRRRCVPRSSIAAAIAIVLPPGEAQASSTRSPGARAGEAPTSCEASSWTTNRPSSCERRQQRIAARERPGRPARNAPARSRRPASRRRSASSSRVIFSAVRAQRQRRRRVVERAHASAASKP